MKTVALVLFTTGPATAEVIYSFSGTTIGGGHSTAGLTQAFTVVSANFFSQANGSPGTCPGYGCILPSDVVPGTCVGCDPELFGGIPTVAQFFPGFPAPPQDYIGFFVATSGIEYVYNFPTGSFTTFGTHTAFGGNPGTLTVTNTPEPLPLHYLFLALIAWFPLRSLLHRRS